MNGLFIVTKKGIVQEARNQKNPDFPLLTCNIILRNADNSFGDTIVARLCGDQTRLPIQENDLVLASLSFFCTEKEGKLYQNVKITAIKKL